jgi:NADPH:quinone reductase-like Zn-dependent oxidoreductase
MRAIQFDAFGDPSVLKLVEVAASAADERTALVRVMAASINPSDVKNVAGAMKAASVGVTYMAAWCGLEAAGLEAGETVLLIGAGGGVASAAAQIARARGARVIGSDRQSPHPDAPIHAIAENLIIGAEDLPAAVRAATNADGVDVVFDTVGGVMFRSAVNSLAWGGRLVEIAATGQREVSFDLIDFYRNESRLFGVDTLKRDLTASAKVLEALTPGFEAGDYRAASVAETCGLGEAQEAYRKVAAGAAGRIVLRPQE